jgi:hypothetical protein
MPAKIMHVRDAKLVASLAADRETLLDTLKLMNGEGDHTETWFSREYKGLHFPLTAKFMKQAIKDQIAEKEDKLRKCGVTV